MTDKNNAFQHGRIQPQAVDIEEAVIGALLMDKDALTGVIDILHPEVFYKGTNQKIYIAIQQLFSKNIPVDIMTVVDQLKKNGTLEEIGGAYHVSILTNDIGSAANIEYHSRILLQLFIKREVIRTGSEMVKDAFEDSTDAFELLDKSGSNVFKISDSNSRKEYTGLDVLTGQAIHEIEIAQSSPAGLRGVPSGFYELDKFTGGWQKSDLYVLAARPGMGKTAFALQLAKNAAVSGFPSVVFSLEMSDIQLATRIISSESEVDSEKLKRGDLSEMEWSKVNRARKQLEETPVFIDDTAALSIFELKAKCRRIKAQQNVELIVIDYIQLMQGDKGGNREQEVSSISRSVKSIAKELNVPIILLSQLNRSVETRGGDKRPMLSDLRESGAIEQDADAVIFIYRPEYYEIETDENGNNLQGVAEIIFGKHRSGSLGSVMLQFVGRYTKFRDRINNDQDYPENTF